MPTDRQVGNTTYCQKTVSTGGCAYKQVDTRTDVQIERRKTNGQVGKSAVDIINSTILAELVLQAGRLLASVLLVHE